MSTRPKPKTSTTTMTTALATTTKTVWRSARGNKAHLVITSNIPPEGLEKATHSLRSVPISEPFLGPLAVDHILPNYTHPSLATLDPGRVSLQLYPSRPTSIHLDRFLFQGRVWDAFRGGWVAPLTLPSPRTRSTTTTTSTTAPPPLVVKLTSPDINNMDVADLRLEITRELWIYDNVLPHLQDKVVPRFYGVYSSLQDHKDTWGGGSAAMLAAVMDYGGDRFSHWRMQQMSGAERKTILAKYGELHDAGLVHTSCSQKHWLKTYGSPMAAMKIVDFGQSYVRDDFEGDVPGCVRILRDTEFERRAEAECVIVRKRLGLC